MKVYVCGKMRGVPLFNRPQFDQIEHRLKLRGWLVRTPITSDLELGFDLHGENTDGSVEPDPEQMVEFLRADVENVIWCDAIALLPDWVQSRGAQMEYWMARYLGRQVLDDHGNPLPLPPTDPLQQDVLEEALLLTSGARHDQYGAPNADFQRIAAMWTTLFSREFSPHEVAMAMICLKLSRMTHSPQKRDHWVDVAGYSRCGWLCLDD
jgi:hypothetical protein